MLAGAMTGLLLGYDNGESVDQSSFSLHPPIQRSQKESAYSVRLKPSELVCRSHGRCHLYGGLPEEILLQQRVSGILRFQ